MSISHWGCNGIMTKEQREKIGYGAINTDEIATNCKDTNSAGVKCWNLVYNGYSDWHLPSKDELLILINDYSKISDFRTDLGYWSSTEINENNAVGYWNGRIWLDASKGNNLHVRPIRYF